MRLRKAWLVSVLVSFIGSAWAQADAARAAKIVSGSCFLCHGENGESSSEIFPKLAWVNWLVSDAHAVGSAQEWATHVVLET
jgi:cytochrome c553